LSSADEEGNGHEEEEEEEKDEKDEGEEEVEEEEEDERQHKLRNCCGAIMNAAWHRRHMCAVRTTMHEAANP